MTDSQFPQLPKVNRKRESGHNDPQKTFKSLLLLGLLLSGIFLLIFWGMGWMTSDSSNSIELFARLQDGTRQSQRIAALAWNQKLQEAAIKKDMEDLKSFSPDLAQTSRLVILLNEKLSKNYLRSSEDEELTIAALLQILSFSQNPSQTMKAYSDICADPRFANLSPNLKSQLFLSLNRLWSPTYSESLQLTEVILSQLGFALQSDDNDLKKVAAFSVGVWKIEEHREMLRALLADISEDVRWNAAFALGRWGYDQDLIGVFEEMLDLAQRIDERGYVSDEKGRVLTESLLMSLTQAFNLLAKLRSKELYPDLEPSFENLTLLSRHHSHLKIRRAALEALELTP